MQRMTNGFLGGYDDPEEATSLDSHKAASEMTSDIPAPRSSNWLISFPALPRPLRCYAGIRQNIIEMNYTVLF